MSDTAPNIDCIWLKDKKFFYFNNGAWEEIVATTVKFQDSADKQAKQDK